MQQQQHYNDPPPNYANTKRNFHGCSSKVSCAQITSYITITFSVIAYFTCIWPIYPNFILLTFFIVIGLFMFISTAYSTLKDPTDRVVYHYKLSKHDKSVEFKPNYSNLLFCEYCDSYCSKKSKHCRACNRCVNIFDHHCQWFNNCVGEKNYKTFMISTVSAFFYSLIVVLHSVIAIVKMINKEQIDVVKMVFSSILVITLGLFAFLLINLIILHIYLNCTDQTTYEFLQKKKRQEKQQKKNQLERRSNNSRVMPQISQTKKIQSCEGSQANLNLKLHEIKVDNKKQKYKLQEKINLQDEIKEQQRSVTEKSKNLNSSNRSNQFHQNHNQSDLVSKLQEQEQQEVEITKKKRKKLPSILKNNSSLKWILNENQAKSPSKKRLNKIE